MTPLLLRRAFLCNFSCVPKPRNFRSKLIPLVVALALLAFPVAIAAGRPAPPKLPVALSDPVVAQAVHHDTSPPMREIQPFLERRIPRAFTAPIRPYSSLAPGLQAPVSPRQNGAGDFDADFDGIRNFQGYVPPDVNGDIGPEHYVQTVNAAWAVFDRDGEVLYGPSDIASLWTGFGGPCENRNDGDPIVQYDDLADRWFVSQFVAEAPFYECIAVSKTDDPTGRYYRYAFLMSTTTFPDYPHFGIWPNGYYMSVHLFDPDTSGYVGQGIAAFDRASMLEGSPGEVVRFRNPDFFGMLPADAQGDTPPPNGAPAYLILSQSRDFDDPADQIVMYEFHIDWSDPNAAEIRGPVLLPTERVDTDICGFNDCIPQKGTQQQLDTHGRNRLMYPAAYRNYGDHESIFMSQNVDVGSARAGVRWIEIRDPGADAEIFQEGKHTESDNVHRWTSSIAANEAGDIGLVYSASSADIFPDIRFAGRSEDDPLGDLRSEQVLKAGGGSQTMAGRWGDYASLFVDPVDDCTFWYTHEYFKQTSGRGWSTRIGTVRVSNCDGSDPTPEPDDTATPTPTESPPGDDHPRTVSLKLQSHLHATGFIVTTDEFHDCSSGAPVRIQKRAGGKWRTLKTTYAVDGFYRVKLSDRPGTYRAKLPATFLLEQPEETCGAAVSSKKRHRH